MGGSSNADATDWHKRHEFSGTVAMIAIVRSEELNWETSSLRGSSNKR